MACFPRKNSTVPNLLGPKPPIGAKIGARNAGLVSAAGPKTSDWCKSWGPKPRIGAGHIGSGISQKIALGQKHRIGAKIGAQNLGLVQKLGPKTSDWCESWGPKPRIGTACSARHISILIEIPPCFGPVPTAPPSRDVLACCGTPPLTQHVEAGPEGAVA